MVNLLRVLTAPVLVFALMVWPPATASGQELCLSEADDIAALRAFEHAVGAYTEIHRLLEHPLSAMRMSSDPEAAEMASEEFARAIAAARIRAEKGEVFGPDVMEFFRARLEGAFAAEGYDAGDLPAHADVQLPPDSGRPVVNERSPWGRGVALTSAMLRALPLLPEELEYRIVDRDLVLVDHDADLVVDVLEDALPSPAQGRHE